VSRCVFTLSPYPAAFYYSPPCLPSPSARNVPEIPAELIDRLNRYQNTRAASVAGWTRDGCLLISTRFAETAQAHRVCQPMGMREQLTFYPEPVAGLTPAPPNAWRDGFIFAKDKGGDEFSQLYWFDAPTRSTTLLTDGKRTQNAGTVISRDGRLIGLHQHRAQRHRPRRVAARYPGRHQQGAGHRRWQLERDGFFARRHAPAGDEVHLGQRVAAR
jgi:hypothetical protein